MVALNQIVGLGLQGAFQGSIYSYYRLLAFAHIHSLTAVCQRDEYTPEHRGKTA